MSHLSDRLGRLGAHLPTILLPADDVAPERWAVIACDQFSSDRGYWEKTRQIVGDAPSTLDLIIPECYLEDEDRTDRESRAGEAMRAYIDEGVLKPLEPGFVFVERSTPHVEKREGLILALDLEAYDFAEGSHSPIRPTEGTIRDRLPPRMAVRRQAALELPHILVLIDDPEDLVMGAARRAADLPGTDTVYDFVLMQSGGRIRGRYITGDDAVSPIVAALEKLSHRSDLLFAVGDGNHSLASAREVWIEKKAAGAPGDDPARYALVEVENIHDPGLPFHPIHRVLFGIDPDSLSRKILSALRAEVRNDDARGSVEQDLIGPPETGRLGVVQGVRTEVWEFPLTGGRLVAEVIQETLDEVLQTLDGVTIDYIHGEDAVRDLTRETDDRLGFILPPVDKKKFFPRITEVGPYPRKTFSIGEAVEKRYYLEARRIEAGIE